MKYFSYFPNCPLVEGASYSAFYDLRTSSIIRFSSELIPKLLILKNATRTEIENSELHPDLSKLASDLIDLGIAAYTMRKNPWIDIAVPDITTPRMPTHALIDVSFNHHDYQKVFLELSEVGCEFIQLRIFQLPLEENLIQKLSAAAYISSMRGVEIIAPFRSFEDRFWLANSLQSNGQISGITFHSAPVQAKDLDIALETGQNIRFQTKRLNSSQDCGAITQSSICAPTVSNFRMLKVSNGCHTGKVGIDADGNIRNCPAARQSFGLIGQTPLERVVLSASFQETWGITKDALEGCKDCEFRYACTDCRVFIDSPDVKTAKPSKCNYDPYTGNWRSNVQY